jgi:rhodanese-related sulfurtransferase
MAAPAGCHVGTAAVQLQDGDTLASAPRPCACCTPRATPPAACASCGRARPEPAQLFSGDTLLIQGCGRADFQSGDAGQLYDSITQRLFTLPDATVVWPAHDYHGRTQSSIGAEKAGNPRLAGKTREQFIALMAELHLPRPRRIDEAVPANQHSGLRQDAGGAPLADDGVRPAQGYAGDVTPQTAQAWMQAGRAVLVDVRTDAEREWVGFVPGAQAVAWKQWPGMALNPDFDAQARAPPSTASRWPCCAPQRRAVDCRRARATELGLVAYNIVGGFEGDPDDNAQRGHLNGWRRAGLPWRQN